MDTEDGREVVTCAKNNDGTLGPRPAWERRHGVLFESVKEFDWAGFDGDGAKCEPKVREEHIRQLLSNGRRLERSHAARELEELSKAKRSAVYEALKLPGGRFAHLLFWDPDTELLSLRPERDEDGAEMDEAV